MNIYFSDYFAIDPDVLEEYGALNVSLINDLPLFIDPFLLFNSEKIEYRNLHDGMIDYLRFLRDQVVGKQIDDGLIQRWFRFPEVKQNWLGYSRHGNNGTGLGRNFAIALHRNLQTVFSSFGNEQVTKGSHIEKLSLIDNGVGRDNISDFTTNLIKEFLLSYTQEFTIENLPQFSLRRFNIDRVRFNYDTESWERGIYTLPAINDEYVILTPKDILTKDEAWISREELFGRYQEIANALPDHQLRAQVNNYLHSQLIKDAKPEDKREAWKNVLKMYPEVLDHYIRLKEDNGNEAITRSSLLVSETEAQFITQVKRFVNECLETSGFYQIPDNTLDEARERVIFMKQVIENNDGYRIFYFKGNPIKREQDLQIIFRFTWFATPSDVNREVNNGRGPVDYKISRGKRDSTLVEFKLASNTQLKRNLQKQIEIYKIANNTKKSIKVIIFFSMEEEARVKSILRELDEDKNPDIILIDARSDNKPSASTA